jgi:hypothetical protein
MSTSGATYPGVPQVVVASTSDEMNLAKPKSLIFINASSSGLAYNRFSGYFCLKYWSYLNVPMNNS